MEYQFCIQTSPADCTGCGNCVDVCPAPKGKALVLKPTVLLSEQYEKSWDYLITLPPKTPPLSSSN